MANPRKAKAPKPAVPGPQTSGHADEAKDDAAFFLEHGTDGLERPGRPGHHRLPDGRLILPLMLDLPRICLYRRCRRAKTCAQADMPCAIGFHIEIAEVRWNRLEKSLAWRTQRWRQIAGPNAPRPPKATQ